MGIIRSRIFVIIYNCEILLGILYTEVVLDLSTLSTFSYIFLNGGNICVDHVTLIFDGVMDAQSYSTLSTFDSAVSFSSLTILLLVTLFVFFNSGPIKVGNIYSSLSTPESDQASNFSAKYQSNYLRIPSTIYQKRHSSSTSYHARTHWLLYRINLVTWVPVYLN